LRLGWEGEGAILSGQLILLGNLGDNPRPTDGFDLRNFYGLTCNELIG
jgi:hypothetical protein